MKYRFNSDKYGSIKKTRNKTIEISTKSRNLTMFISEICLGPKNLLTANV